MSSAQLLGLAILTVGVALLIFGYNSSDAPIEEISGTLAGRYANDTAWSVIGGIALLVVGGSAILLGKRT